MGERPGDDTSPVLQTCATLGFSAGNHTAVHAKRIPQWPRLQDESTPVGLVQESISRALDLNTPVLIPKFAGRSGPELREQIRSPDPRTPEPRKLSSFRTSFVDRVVDEFCECLGCLAIVDGVVACVCVHG